MKRRYKLLLIIIISFILVIIIYKINYKPKINYLFLGKRYNDYETYDFNDYINHYYKDKNYYYYEITDKMILDEYQDIIKENKYNINYKIKNASFIVISLGTYELTNYKELDSTIIIEYLNNVYTLLSYIRSINKGEIFLINFYNEDLNYVNNKIKKYTKEFKIYYIDKTIPEANNLYNINKNLTITNKGHKKIADYIINKTLSWYNSYMKTEPFVNQELIDREISAIKKANKLEALGFSIEEVIENVKGKPLLNVLVDKILNATRNENIFDTKTIIDNLSANPGMLIEKLLITRDKLTSEESKNEYNKVIFIVKNLDKIMPFM